MEQQGVAHPQTIAVSGSTGLVGSTLCKLLKEQGREVRPIVRRNAGESNEILWDTSSQSFDKDGLAKCDAVVHLAGENIMGRWTDDKKRRILDSRIDSTRGLSQALAKLAADDQAPRTLIVASAIGYYGDTGQTAPRDEDDSPGDGFLADVCVDWEKAADPARDAGIRVVHIRIGIVLSSEGGAIKEMLLPFKLGLGGPLGDGRQWMSWITLHDLIRVIVFSLDTPGLSGPVNAVAPEPATNRSLTKAMGRVLKRPTFLPAPPFAIRLLYGQQCADEIVLASIRVIPNRLNEAGFTFTHTDLDSALRHELGL